MSVVRDSSTYDADQPYDSLRRLFWRVLANLSAQGFVAGPSESLDLIQDFRAEAWPQLVQRYDPQQGKLSSFAAKAFYRFARRKIIRLRQWDGRLANLAGVEHERQPTPLEQLERSEEIASVRRSMQSLLPLHREILSEFLWDPGLSERQLSRRFGITRYALREALVQSLGQVAFALGHSPESSRLDAQIVGDLWREGRSIRDTALDLGITAAEVRSVRDRYVASLLRALRGDVPSSQAKEISMDTQWLAILKKAIFSNDRSTLEAVKNNRQAILDALDEDDVEFSEDEYRAILAEQGSRLAEVYRALGHDSGPRTEDGPDVTVLDLDQTEEETEIGLAFRDLLEGLDRDFGSWDGKWFKQVPDASRKYQQLLESEPAVCAGGTYAKGLIRYGMTPLNFVGAAHGTRILLDRLTELAQSPPFDERMAGRTREFLARLANQGPNVPFLLSADPEQDDPALVPRELFIAHVRGTPALPAEAAEPLASWMVQAARRRPLFFPGYRATRSNACVVSLIPEAIDRPLAVRWHHD